MLDILRALNLSRTIYIILIILNGMIERVAVGEKLEFVNRTINRNTDGALKRIGPQTTKGLPGQVATG